MYVFLKTKMNLIYITRDPAQVKTKLNSKLLCMCKAANISHPAT